MEDRTGAPIEPYWSWIQDETGVVHVRLLETVSASARRSLDAEAARLTEWLGGVRIGTGYVSRAMKQAAEIAGATP